LHIGGLLETAFFKSCGKACGCSLPGSRLGL
jgi:hypothetical protein